MGSDGLDGPKTEMPLYLTKGRGVALKQAVADEVKDPVPGLSRRGFGHARSIADICLLCQIEEGGAFPGWHSTTPSGGDDGLMRKVGVTLSRPAARGDAGVNTGVPSPERGAPLRSSVLGLYLSSCAP